MGRPVNLGDVMDGDVMDGQTNVSLLARFFDANPEYGKCFKDQRDGETAQDFVARMEKTCLPPPYHGGPGAFGNSHPVRETCYARE